MEGRPILCVGLGGYGRRTCAALRALSREGSDHAEILSVVIGDGGGESAGRSDDAGHFLSVPPVSPSQLERLGLGTEGGALTHLGIPRSALSDPEALSRAARRAGEGLLHRVGLRLRVSEVARSLVSILGRTGPSVAFLAADLGEPAGAGFLEDVAALLSWLEASGRGGPRRRIALLRLPDAGDSRTGVETLNRCARCLPRIEALLSPRERGGPLRLLEGTPLLHAATGELLDLVLLQEGAGSGAKDGKQPHGPGQAALASLALARVLSRQGEALLDSLALSGRHRGRSCRYASFSCIRIVPDLERGTVRQAVTLARELARALRSPRRDAERAAAAAAIAGKLFDKLGAAEHLCAGPATLGEIEERARPLTVPPGTTPSAGLALLERKMLARAGEWETREQRGSAFLHGGKISRLTHKTSPGFFREVESRCAGLVLQSRYSLDEAISVVNALGARFSQRPGSELSRHLEARIMDLRRQIQHVRTGQEARLSDLLGLLFVLEVARGERGQEARFCREAHEGLSEINARLLRANENLSRLPAHLSAADAGGHGEATVAFPYPERLVRGRLKKAGVSLSGLLAHLGDGRRAGGFLSLGSLSLADLGARVMAYLRSPLEDLTSTSVFLRTRECAVGAARIAASAAPSALVRNEALARRQRVPAASWVLVAEPPAAGELARLLPSPPKVLASPGWTGATFLSLSGGCPIGSYPAVHEILKAAGPTPGPEPCPPDLFLACGVAEDGTPDRFLLAASELREAALAGDLTDASAVGHLASLMATLPEGADPAARALLEALVAWLSHDGIEPLRLLDREILGAAGFRRREHSAFFEFLDAAAPLADLARKAGEVAGVEDRVHYLTRMDSSVEDLSRLADETLPEPERSVARLATGRWRDSVRSVLRRLQGRAEMEVALLTMRLLYVGATTLRLRVRATGRHAARDVTLRLLPSAEFRVVGEETRSWALVKQDGVLVEFAVKPKGPGALRLDLEVSWDDDEASGKSRQVSVEAHLVPAERTFRSIPRNPYIAGPPVRGAEMFFGRDDIFEFVRANLSGTYQDNVLVLHGQRRTGKSSILWQMERRDLLAEHKAVLVDLQGLGRMDTAGFFHGVARLIGRRLDGDPEARRPATPERSRFVEDDPYAVFTEFLDDLEEAVAASRSRVLLMFDEFEVLETAAEKGRLDPEVFGFLRSLMQSRENIAFLLTGTHQLAEMREDYWSVLFSLATYRRVSFLGPEEARSLMERPSEGYIQFDDLAKETILHLTAGHPYYIQLLCQHLVNHLNTRARHNYVTPEDIRAVAEEVLINAGAQFEYEWRACPDPLARSVLRVVAGLDDTGLRFIGLDEVAGRLDEAAGGGDPRALRRSVAALAGRDLLETSPDGSAVRYRADIMRQWARRQGAAAEHARSSEPAR